MAPVGLITESEIKSSINQSIKLRRYKDIIGIRTADDADIIGFHSKNLQVADLDSITWQSFQQNTPETSQARSELELWNQEVSTETTDIHIPQVATSFVVNITQICNLRCTYCAAGGDGTYGDRKGKVDVQLIQPQILDRLKMLKEGDIFHLHFFGGEPLLHPEAIKSLANFTQLAGAGSKIEIRFNITTNGTLVTKDIAELLASIKCNITLSLDGPPELNDSRRPDVRGQPSTQRTITGLSNLIAVRDRLGKIVVTGVFGKKNLSLVEAYKFYEPYNFDGINFSYQITEENDSQSLKIFLSQFGEVLKLARKKGEDELRKISNVNQYFTALDEQTRNMNHCGAGKNLMFSDVRGQLFSCAWLINDKAEMIGKHTEIYSEQYQNYADPLIEKNDCGQCWARYLCGGGCMVVNKTKTGNKHKKDFEFCTRTRTQIALSLVEYARLRREETYEAH